MSLYDLPLDALRSYRPAPHEPADFDSFWDGTLSEARVAGSRPGSSRSRPG